MDERRLQPLDQVGIHWKWKLSTFLLQVHFKAMSTGGIHLPFNRTPCHSPGKNTHQFNTTDHAQIVICFNYHPVKTNDDFYLFCSFKLGYRYQETPRQERPQTGSQVSGRLLGSLGQGMYRSVRQCKLCVEFH